MAKWRILRGTKRVDERTRVRVHFLEELTLATDLEILERRGDDFLEVNISCPCLILEHAM